MNENKSFRRVLDIDVINGHFRTPVIGLEPEVQKVIDDAIEQHSGLLGSLGTYTLKEFATLIKESNVFDNKDFTNIADKLNNIEALTLVVFDGDHRNESKVDYQQSVIKIDIDTAKNTVHQILDNELKSEKYKDGNARRISIFNSNGAELKSEVQVQDKPVSRKRMKP